MNFNKNTEKQENIIIGRNCVLEALKNEREIDSIMVERKKTGGTLSVILAKAASKGIPIKEVDVKKLDYLCGHSNHQGIIAFVAIKEYCELEDVLAYAKEKGEDPFIVILDEIEDPHNLGAIIRTAECAGAHAVVIPKRRACSVTYAASKASCGAVEYMNIIRVTNISSFIEKLKKQNIWVYAADMDGESIYNSNLTGGIAIVIGNEGKGVSRLVRDKCDGVLSLPMYGRINSLNASVAAGIFIYEAVKQRKGL